jgi:hypothetical protein
MKIKNKVLNFERFINESFEDNLGVPRGYFDRVVANGSLRYKTGGPDYGNYLSVVNQIQNKAGNKQKLQDLAERIIRDNYSSDILENFEMEIIIGDPGKLKKGNLSESLDKSRGERLKQALDKKKILNAIQQGEAKNAWDLIKEYRGELIEILGANDGKEYYENLKKVIDATDVQDWTNEISKENAERLFSNPSGKVEIIYPKNKPVSESKEKKENNTNKIIIRAVGVDLFMVIHEAIKGIYFIVTGTMGSVKKEFAKEVKKETEGYVNEMINLKYGKIMAKDLRNYIERIASKNKSMPDNIVERFIWYLSQMEDSDFLELMYDIFLTITMQESVGKRNEKLILKTYNKTYRILEKIVLEKYIQEVESDIAALEKKEAEYTKKEKLKEANNVKEEIEKYKKVLQDAIERLKNLGVIVTSTR